ncbi:MAG: DUF6494 family protein [Candidatus Marinimicrobia bacterium]|nr:DUF6494 family protein [Candidatus Neomarinimicrobiota bacterium]
MWGFDSPLRHNLFNYFNLKIRRFLRTVGVLSQRPL